LLAEPSVKRIANANVEPSAASEDAQSEEDLVSAVDQAIQAGKQVIYVSLGTVATSEYFYQTPFGHFGRENGLEDVTGRQLAQHVFGCCFEAFGNKEDLLVALSLGPQEDVLDGLPELPSNFIARKSMPQLQLLKRCSAFLTHAGANSMHEALGLGAPMVVVPMFGDQPLNGDAIARCGAGFNFRLPMESVTSDSLRTATQQLLEPAPGCSSYHEAARAMSVKLANAGGAAAAVDAILQEVHAWKATGPHPRLLGFSQPQGKELRGESAGEGTQLDAMETVSAMPNPIETPVM